jgi:hypothetical protein
VAIVAALSVGDPFLHFNDEEGEDNEKESEHNEKIGNTSTKKTEQKNETTAQSKPGKYYSNAKSTSESVLTFFV